MRIIPLSEGSFTIDHTKEFVPFQKGTDDLQQRPIGSLLVEIQPFIIETGEERILIDSGLGFCNEQNVMQIHQNMLDQDVDPLSITRVLMSHLHKDHSGGLLKYDHWQQRYFPAFPQAVHYINQKELQLALEPGNPSYHHQKMQAIDQELNIQLLDDKGELDGFIQYEVTGAHSPHHMVFSIETNQGIVFFGGDDAPQLQQMKSRFVAKYDYDGKKSMELRKLWWEKAQLEHWTMLFYHDINTPTIAF